MKLSIYAITVLFLISSVLSCKKDDGVSKEDVAKANEFKAFVKDKQFQISEYYSDKPIDYIQDDGEVRAETDLWRYVSLWIKDDYNLFDLSTGKVTITQNADKIEGNTDATIVKSFSIGADKEGVYFDFLNYQYNPLKYRLVEFTGDHFLVYADWNNGEKVFTNFTVQQP